MDNAVASVQGTSTIFRPELGGTNAFLDKVVVDFQSAVQEAVMRRISTPIVAFRSLDKYYSRNMVKCKCFSWKVSLFHEIVGR